MTERRAEGAENRRYSDLEWPVFRRQAMTLLMASGVGLLAGCTDGGESQPATTEPQTPKTAAVPYTAADADANVGLIRDLRIWNNTERDQEVRVAITDTETATEFYRRTVTVEAETEPRFRDLLGKKGLYEISFELAVGVSKTFEWPVDADNGDARAVIGGDPVNPTLTFRIEPL